MDRRGLSHALPLRSPLFLEGTHTLVLVARAQRLDQGGQAQRLCLLSRQPSAGPYHLLDGTHRKGGASQNLRHPAIDRRIEFGQRRDLVRPGRAERASSASIRRPVRSIPIASTWDRRRGRSAMPPSRARRPHAARADQRWRSAPRSPDRSRVRSRSAAQGVAVDPRDHGNVERAAQGDAAEAARAAAPPNIRARSCRHPISCRRR